MLLAVAGLDEAEIRRRTATLASGDWSDLAPAERLALQFAHKLAREPWQLSRKDMQTLTDAFGPHRAVDLLWHGAWCNYMTLVADAFQMPLERENVFEGRRPTRPSGEKRH